MISRVDCGIEEQHVVPMLVDAKQGLALRQSGLVLVQRPVYRNVGHSTASNCPTIPLAFENEDVGDVKLDLVLVAQCPQYPTERGRIQ